MATLLKKLFVIITVTLTIVTLYFSPKVVMASGFSWHQSVGIGQYSQEIRIASSDHNIVYATLRTATGSGLFKSTDQAVTFTPLLPIIGGRDVNSIAISAINASKLCIGTYEQGVFCSSDGGINFSNSGWISSGLINIAVRFVVADPTNDNIFYAGTGQSNSDGGIYKTVNFGTSWQKIGLTSFGSKNSLNIFVDSNDHNRLLAGSDWGLYTSEDGGVTWTLLNSFNTNFPATIIDSLNSTTIYTGVNTSGVYKSTNNGTSWIPKNVGIESAFTFRLSQDSSGVLFGSRRNSPGGVWRSKDYGETWENVGDPSWGQRNTWGLDAAGQRVIVSVEGLGIYYADTNPSQPNPVVLLPGFGGSWSHKGLVENQPTVAADWTILPFADAYYQPFLTTLKNAGLTDSGANQNLFTFAYDYRKSITDTAVVLNNYLDEVLTKNPGKKANLVTHSMGSLIARQCYEKVAGCANKIEKVITAGGPHQGTIKAYQLWEGGEIDVSDLVTKAAIEIALHATNLPYLSDKDIVQSRFPGVRDLLPVFNFISGKPYTSMSSLGKNPNLENLVPISSNFNSAVYPLSGNNIQTNYTLTAIPLTALDTAMGLWPDGKPGTFTTAVGDGTILKTSSEISGNANNKYYSFWHNDYLRDTTSITDIFTILGLSSPSIPSLPSIPSSFLSFIIHSPATISVKDQAGNLVGTNIDGQAVFISNPTSQTYQITLTGTGNGPISVDSFYTNSSSTTKDTYNGTISIGASQTINYQNYDFTSSLASFRAKVTATNNRGLRTIEAMAVTAVNNISNNKNRAGAFLNLENSLLNIWKLVMTENNGQTRQNLSETAEQLQNLLVSLNSQYRTEPTPMAIGAEITRAQKSVNLKLAKLSLTSREAVNLTKAQAKLTEAQTFLTANKNYSAALSSRVAIILSN